MEQNFTFCHSLHCSGCLSSLLSKAWCLAGSSLKIMDIKRKVGRGQRKPICFTKYGIVSTRGQVKETRFSVFWKLLTQQAMLCTNCASRRPSYHLATPQKASSIKLRILVFSGRIAKVILLYFIFNGVKKTAFLKNLRQLLLQMMCTAAKASDSSSMIIFWMLIICQILC